MPRKDKLLQKDYADSWYEENKERKQQYALSRYKDRNEQLREIKRIPCVDCGRTYSSYIMEFDHVRGTKLFNLSKAQSRKWENVLVEIEKCDIVCSNCHRERTHRRWCKQVICQH